MVRTGSLLLAVCGIGLLSLGAVRPFEAAAQAPEAGAPNAPIPVLSDTPEYCTVLEQRIMRMPGQTQDARQLLVEGRLLCDHGQVRQGIANLRRALLILKHKGNMVVQP